MRRLAVIDDDRAFCDTMRDILEAEGFEVRTATDGPSGIALAREWQPDLVVCDLHMEGPSGFDVLRELRQDRVTASIPVVFLTGDRGDFTQRQGMELGADDFLIKPVEHATLLRAIEARIARRGQILHETERRIADLRASISHSVPHEFLTPLTGVLGLSSLLVEDGAILPPDAIHEAAVGIYDAGQQLHRLVEKFLLFAELELNRRGGAGTRPSIPRPSPTEAASIVADAARREADRRGRIADVDLSGIRPSPSCLSRDHLGPLVRELIENACTFSAPGTPIVTCLEGTGGTTVLTIEDRGRGMTPQQVRDLDAFIQLDRRQMEQPGAGLGLAIVKRIAEAAGGTVAIESAPGRGTQVMVSLPHGQRASS